MSSDVKSISIYVILILCVGLFFEVYIYIEEYGLKNLIERIWIGKFVACGEGL